MMELQFVLVDVSLLYFMLILAGTVGAAATHYLLQELRKDKTLDEVTYLCGTSSASWSIHQWSQPISPKLPVLANVDSTSAFIHSLCEEQLLLDNLKPQSWGAYLLGKKITDENKNISDPIAWPLILVSGSQEKDKIFEFCPITNEVWALYNLTL